MAYVRRRRYRPRRRRRGAVAWYNKKYSVMDLAGKAYSGVKYLKGLVNSELYSIEASATINPSTTGSVIHLTPVAQGDDESNRTGNGIFVRSLFMRIASEQDSSATTTFIRHIIFIDKQQIGDTTPGVTDVISSASYLSPLNNATEGRFKLLYDRTYEMDDSRRQGMCTKIYKSLKLHVRYNGTAATDIQKNGIYMLFISNHATTTPSLTYSYRTSYHDN